MYSMYTIILFPATRRERHNVPIDAFPRTTVCFEGYYLDTFDCEIFAAWFLATKDWYTRHTFYKEDERHYGISIPFNSIHPDYPCAPYSLAEPEPDFDWDFHNGPYLCRYERFMRLYFWRNTKRAEQNFHPRPTLMDLRVVCMNWKGAHGDFIDDFRERMDFRTLRLQFLERCSCGWRRFKSRFDVI